jgi:hypothetical protein
MPPVRARKSIGEANVQAIWRNPLPKVRYDRMKIQTSLMTRMAAVALQLVGKTEGMWQGEQRKASAVPIS